MKLKRLPVSRTIGVSPMGTQIVPPWQSDRMLASSPKHQGAVLVAVVVALGVGVVGQAAMT